MFEVVMRLEECISSVKLHQNASDTPYITRITPTKVENDFWGTVVTRRDNRGVILVIERG
jgi:hypothetical protein